MKKIISLFAILGFAGSIHAALPPRYQNLKDLEVMVTFIQQHPRVASGLDSINMRKKVIYFNTGCEALFGRRHIERPPGWVGPAAPLEFKQSNCRIDD